MVSTGTWSSRSSEYADGGSGHDDSFQASRLPGQAERSSDGVTARRRARSEVRQRGPDDPSVLVAQVCSFAEELNL